MTDFRILSYSEMTIEQLRDLEKSIINLMYKDPNGNNRVYIKQLYDIEKELSTR